MVGIGEKGQVAIEYLILAAVALTVSAVVVMIALNAFGGQIPTVNINNCRAAAQVCKNALLLNTSAQCSQCDTACADSTGKEVTPGAASCCKTGQPEKIYSGVTGVCAFGDLVAVPGSISLSNPNNPQVGIAVTVSAKVNNSGKYSSPSTNAKLYVKPTGGTFTEIAAPNVPSLAPGEETTVQASWTPTNYSAWDIRFAFDPTNAIPEDREDNNNVSTTVTNTDTILRLTGNVSYHGWNTDGSSTQLSAYYFPKEPEILLAGPCASSTYAVRFWMNMSTLTEPNGVTKKLYVGYSTTSQGAAQTGMAVVNQSFDGNTTGSYNITYIASYSTGSNGAYFAYFGELADPKGDYNQTTNTTLFRICNTAPYGGGGGTGGSAAQCPAIPCPSPSSCVSGYCMIPSS